MPLVGDAKLAGVPNYKNMAFSSWDCLLSTLISQPNNKRSKFSKFWIVLFSLIYSQINLASNSLTVSVEQQRRKVRRLQKRFGFSQTKGLFYLSVGQ